MSVTYDSGADFIAAHSLFVALEEACLPMGSADTLPYLGMARGEFTDHGLHLPTHLDEASFDSFAEGMDRLEGLLTKLERESTQLGETLRYNRTRAIVAEGRDAS